MGTPAHPAGRLQYNMIPDNEAGRGKYAPFAAISDRQQGTTMHAALPSTFYNMARLYLCLSDLVNIIPSFLKCSCSEFMFGMKATA